MAANLLRGWRFAWTVVGVGLIALGLRLLYLHEIQHSPLFATPVVDARTYVEDARYLTEVSWLGRPAPFWQPPLYPYALALLFRVFGENLLIPRVFQAILGSVVCMLTCLIGRRIFSPAIALGAGLAAALYGPLIYFGGELLPVVLAIFIQLLLLLLVCAFHRGRWPWLLAGLLLSLAALTVANFLLFLPFLFFWLWLFGRRQGVAPRYLAQQSTLLLGGCLLIIAPVTLRNYWIGGDWVLISHNAGVNFYIGNNPEYDHTVGIRPGKDWAQLIDLPKQEAGIERPAARSRYFFACSWEFILSEPLSYSRLLLRKVYLFWRGDELKRNLDPYFARRDSRLLSVLLWKRGLAFPFGLVSPLALLGLVAFWRSPAGRTPGGRLLILFLLVYTASVVLFFVTSRYRLPAVPMLLLFAGWGVRECLVERHKKALIAFLLLLLLANFEVGAMEMEGDPAQRFWLGYAYEQQNMSAHAVREYRAVLQHYPDHESAMLRLAALYSDRQEYLKAIEIYRQFLQFYPQSERVRFLLANAYLQVQYYGKAVAEYEELVPVLPDWAELHGRLGYAHLMTGRPDRAISAYRRTLELNPDSSLVRYQLARLHQAEGNLQAAFEEYQVLVLQAPDRAEYRAYLADALIEQESAGRENILLERTLRTVQAEEQLREAIRLEPTYLLSYWFLGLLLARQDRYLEATGVFEQIAALTPQEAQVYVCLGNLYERTGRKAEAEESFARSAWLEQHRRLQSRVQSDMEAQLEKVRKILERLGR